MLKSFSTASGVHYEYFYFYCDRPFTTWRYWKRYVGSTAAELVVWVLSIQYIRMCFFTTQKVTMPLQYARLSVHQVWYPLWKIFYAHFYDFIHLKHSTWQCQCYVKVINVTLWERSFKLEYYTSFTCRAIYRRHEMTKKWSYLLDWDWAWHFFQLHFFSATGGMYYHLNMIVAHNMDQLEKFQAASWASNLSLKSSRPLLGALKADQEVFKWFDMDLGDCCFLKIFK